MNKRVEIANTQVMSFPGRWGYLIDDNPGAFAVGDR